jgi:hypothetical protein
MSRRVAKTATKPETAADLEAMSNAQLADAFGPVATALKPLEKRAEAFKKEFTRRCGSLFVGEKWSAFRIESTFDGVDVVKAKAELGAAWCEANKRPVTRVSWKANFLTPADLAPAAIAAVEAGATS